MCAYNMLLVTFCCSCLSVCDLCRIMRHCYITYIILVKHHFRITHSWRSTIDRRVAWLSTMVTLWLYARTATHLLKTRWVTDIPLLLVTMLQLHRCGSCNHAFPLYLLYFHYSVTRQNVRLWCLRYNSMIKTYAYSLNIFSLVLCKLERFCIFS